MEILSGLDTFLLLAQSGSVSQTARALGLPRSTVSRRLARLEEEVGELLFDRNSRSLRLTETGRLLAERGLPLVAALRALRDDLRQLKGVARGPLRVSAPPGLGSDFLAEFLRRLRARLPELKPDLIIRDGIPNLLEENIDLAFCEGPMEDLPWFVHPVGPADRIVVASEGYLARRGTPRSPEELAGHDCLGLRSARDRPSQWPLRGGGVMAVAPVLRSNDVQVLRQAAVSGLGVALLPAYAVALDLIAGRLVPILPAVGRPATLLALTARRRSDSAKLNAFFELLEDFVTNAAPASADYLPGR